MKRPTIRGRWSGRAALKLWRTTGTWTVVAWSCWSAASGEPLHWHSAPPNSFHQLAPFLGLRLAGDPLSVVPDASAHGWQLLTPDDGGRDARVEAEAGRSNHVMSRHTADFSQSVPTPQYSFDAPIESPTVADCDHADIDGTRAGSDATDTELIDDMPAWPGEFSFPEIDDAPSHEVSPDLPRIAPPSSRATTQQSTTRKSAMDSPQPVARPRDQFDFAEHVVAAKPRHSGRTPAAAATPVIDAAQDGSMVIINPMVKAKPSQSSHASDPPTHVATPIEEPIAPSVADTSDKKLDTEQSLTALDSHDDWFADDTMNAADTPQFDSQAADDVLPSVEQHPVSRSMAGAISRSVPKADDSVLPLHVGSAENVSLPAGPVQQAREYINEGIRQAQRGAIYSSRAQFIKVLRLVSQSLDAQSNSTVHSEALSAGMRALKEAADFRPSGSSVEGNLDVKRVVMSHRTPILRERDTSKLTPLAAVQAYHTYAEQQLSIAGGHELTAADALYGLAKLQPHLDVVGADQDGYDGPIAMSYFQAALMIYPDHYLAANELGVLFARFGQLKDARDVLRFAASTNPECAETWLNLSRVHDKLGEVDLAKLAHEEWRSLSGTTTPADASSSGRPQVEWVTPDEFSRAGDGVSEESWGPDHTAGPRSARRPSDEAEKSTQQPMPQNSKKRRSWPFS